MDNTAPAQAGSGRFGGLLSPRVLDRGEQLVILVLWGIYAWRMYHAPNAYGPLIMISETAVVLFTLFRRPTDAISTRPGDWILAFTATIMPLQVLPAENAFPALASLGIFLLVFGNCMQAWAKLVLRRSFGITAANRGVKVTGPYRFMRHPMYAGYLLVHIGALVVMFSAWNLMVYAIGWTAQILRLLAEERLLERDPQYREYTGEVRWRLIPGVF